MLHYPKAISGHPGTDPENPLQLAQAVTALGEPRM